MGNWRHWQQQHFFWLGAFISGTLILVCYGFVLQLPFFFDDLPIMTWLGCHNWADILLQSNENDYYRPLAFSIYKLGLFFPLGIRQIALHATNLIIYWLSALLVMQVVQLCDQDHWRAILASALFAVFPFMFRALPWITAMPHLLVTWLTLLAVYAALRAERDNTARWWGISLLATALAPLAHESGVTCSVIVGGVVITQYGVRSGRRRMMGILAGLALNVAGVLWHQYIPGIRATHMIGLDSWFEGSMFFLHGLVYPIAPIIGWLVFRQGWHDFTLIGMSSLLLFALLLWRAYHTQEWRWIARNVWWWGCGGVIAVMFLTFDSLFNSPRVLALASPGITMLWAGIIMEAGKLLRSTRGQRLAQGILASAIIIQNIAFLNTPRSLHLSLNHIYQQVLDVAKEESNAPIGFVNLPDWLSYKQKTYSLVTEGVLFLPFYSNIGEFIQVNIGWKATDSALFSPVLQELEPMWFGFHQNSLDWEQMRQFLVTHHTIWLSRYRNGQFELDRAGSISVEQSPSSSEPLVRFDGGPVIESVSAQQTQAETWAVTLTWFALGPLEDGEIFVHVRDANNNLVAQVDGPALGGLLPIWLWQSGDRIYDVRQITVPKDGGPYTVQVGLYNSQGRLPAFIYDSRCAHDAATVISIGK